MGAAAAESRFFDVSRRYRHFRADVTAMVVECRIIYLIARRVLRNDRLRPWDHFENEAEPRLTGAVKSDVPRRARPL